MIEDKEPVDQDGLIDDATLVSILKEDLADAEDYTDVLIGADRAKAMDYYLRRPMGDERKGRSHVISGEVFKVVEGLTTAIANIFAQTKNPIQFTPRKAEDEDAASERTQVCEYIYNHMNNGLENDVSAIKDGLLLKTGILTWRFEKDTTVKIEKYTGQPVDVVPLLLDNPNVELIEQSQPYQGMEGEVVDLTVKVTDSDGKIVVESGAPEEWLVTSKARGYDLQKAPCVIWRRMRSRDELLSAGYAEDVVDSLNFNGTNLSASNAVFRANDKLTGSFADGEALIYKFWKRIDVDGDGIPELRCIEISDNDIVLSNEITDEVPAAAWTPNPQPHEFIGRCPADELVESQEVQTAVLRGTLDNLYFANNPMWRVDPNNGGNALRQLLNPTVGQVITAKKDMVEPVVFPFVAQHSMAMLEYFKADDENKSGFTRYAQGMDSKSLNDTATGIKLITNMSQERVKLMARLYAECKSKAVKGIAKLLSQHCQEMKPITLRLTNGYKTVDPREWAEEFDMSINVGLGVVDREEQKMSKMAIAAAQAQAIQAGGLGKIVTLKNVYELQSDIAELSGEKNPQKYWTDPDSLPPSPPPPEPPEIQKAKLDAQSKSQSEQLKAQVDVQTSTQKAQIDAQLEAYKAELKKQTEVEIAHMKERFAQSVRDKQQQEVSAVKAEDDVMMLEQINSIVQQSRNDIASAIGNQTQMLVDSVNQMTQAIQSLAELQMAPKQATLSNGRVVRVTPQLVQH